jgi:large subunit ribosomal protein L9
MRLLLREDVEKLGQRGEVIEVKDGFARNYLVPRGLGVLVTPENVRQLELERRRISQREARRVEELQQLARRLEGASCTIEVKASPEGHLYGSVSPRMITDAFKKSGIEIEEKSVRLERPIKEIGPHDVPIILHGDLTANVKVWVIEATEEKREGAFGEP